jgi:hypothetical protein
MPSELTAFHDGVPSAIRVPGFEPLFHFWRGASGHRYLFTHSAPEAMAHFRDVVVLIAEPAGDGALVGRCVALAESHEARRELLDFLAANPRCQAFVHFLAESAGDRRTVLADLLGTGERLAA